MDFQFPGLNSIYYLYKTQDTPSLEDIDLAVKKSSIRMLVVFLSYIIPVVCGFISILLSNMNVYFICIAVALLSMLINFYMDRRMEKKYN